MPGKLKVAIYWCSACGGCDEAIVDIGERILAVKEAVDFVFWPCAMDQKYSDVRQMSENEIDVTFISGSIRMSEHEEIVELLREKSKMIIALGSCSSFGGIPALANLSSKESIMANSYLSGPTVVNPEATLPLTHSSYEGYEFTLPSFSETVSQLNDIIDVDYYLPGCAPTADMIYNAFEAILENKLPEKGAILLPNIALCKSCERNESKPEHLNIKEFKRLIEIQADPALCFLTQGILCMGPATRDGCEYPCIKGNMPCTGCQGPVGDIDQGGRMLAALGGIFEGDTEQQVAQQIKKIPDPVGTFYRYSLSSSYLGKKRKGD